MRFFCTLLLICLALNLSDGFWRPKFGKIKFNMKRVQDRSLDVSVEPKIKKSSWLDFTLIYFYEDEKSFEISQPDEIFEMRLTYKPEYKNVFIVHGWQNSFTKNHWITEMKNDIFKKHDGQVNVFIVDWFKYASLTLYARSAQFTRTLGEQLSSVLISLEEEFKIDLNKTHIIGHSLGAHAAGFTGKNLLKKGFTLGRITGLDPAGPGFMVSNPENRLDKDDARIVEVLHTNMGNHVGMGLGTPMKISNVGDIFLNGGARQPGCFALLKDMDYDRYFKKKRSKKVHPVEPLSNDENSEEKALPFNLLKALSCHHGEAVSFYKSLIIEDLDDSCQTIAYECESYSDFLNGECSTCGDDNSKCQLYQYNVGLEESEVMNANRRNSTSSFFMKTNPKKPFCTKHYVVELEVSESDADYGKFDVVLVGEQDQMTITIASSLKNEVFKTLITSNSNLGQLKSATISYKKSWFEYNKKKINIKGLNLIYMSHMDPKIRNLNSAKLDCQKSSDNDKEFRCQK